MKHIIPALILTAMMTGIPGSVGADFENDMTEAGYPERCEVFIGWKVNPEKIKNISLRDIVEHSPIEIAYLLDIVTERFGRPRAYIMSCVVTEGVYSPYIRPLMHSE